MFFVFIIFNIVNNNTQQLLSASCYVRHCDHLKYIN